MLADHESTSASARVNTDARHAEALLNEERYRTLFELCPVAVYACDAEGVIQQYNRHAATLWGREPRLGDTDGRFCGSFKLFRPDGSFMPHEQCPMSDVVSGKVSEVCDAEVLIERPDGSRVTVIVNIRPVFNSRGEATAAINGFHDVTARKQTEAALLQAGALQNAIFNSANFSSIATDAKGVIQIFNVGAERMLGYTAAEVMNRITPADISDPQEVIARAEALSLELGTPITPGFEALVFKASRGIEDIYELTYIRKDGSRFPAAVSVTALRDAQNAIIGYLLIGADNTARKQAEEALAKAAAELAAMQTAVSEAAIVAITDVTGKIEQVNDNFVRISKYSREELIGQDHCLLNSGLHPKEFIRDLWVTIANGKVWRNELRNRAKDGSLYWVDTTITPIRNERDKVFKYMAVRFDVTARKQAEEALLQAGALQKAIFDSANFSSIATDAKGVIQIFNVGAERMLGYTAAEVMNKITPADISDPQEVIARAKALSVELGTPITPGFEALVFKASRGIEDIYELTYIRKDGSRFPAVVSVTALRDAQNAIIGYLLIGTDNTARKLAESIPLDKSIRVNRD